MDRDPDGIAKAKRLRREMTPPEHALWKLLRGHRLQGWKFTRQVPVGSYIVDFAARREKLVIELDGDSHVGHEYYDARRTIYLESQGWSVIRFTNLDIMRNPEGVMMQILNVLNKLTPLPDPLPNGEREE